MNLQTNISEGSAMVEKLLAKRPVPFRERTPKGIPDKAGIYLLSDSNTAEHLYVGKSVNIKGRIQMHWDGPNTSAFAKALIRGGLASNKSECQSFIRENVAIYYLAQEDFGFDIEWAEHFVIGALRPRLNTRLNR